MKGQRLVILGLLLALFALLTPLGIYVMRTGGQWSLIWVFGIWAVLVLIAGISSRRKRNKEEDKGG